MTVTTDVASTPDFKQQSIPADFKLHTVQFTRSKRLWVSEQKAIHMIFTVSSLELFYTLPVHLKEHNSVKDLIFC